MHGDTGVARTAQGRRPVVFGRGGVWGGCWSFPFFREEAARRLAEPASRSSSFRWSSCRRCPSRSSIPITHRGVSATDRPRSRRTTSNPSTPPRSREYRGRASRHGGAVVWAARERLTSTPARISDRSGHLLGPPRSAGRGGFGGGFGGGGFGGGAGGHRAARCHRQRPPRTYQRRPSWSSGRRCGPRASAALRDLRVTQFRRVDAPSSNAFRRGRAAEARAAPRGRGR